MGRIGSSRAWRISPKRCYYCDIPLVPATATRDHVVPRISPDFDQYKGRSNIVISCQPCNTFKGEQTVDEFLRSDWFQRRIRREK